MLLRQAEALHPGRVEAMRFGQAFLAGLRERPLRPPEAALLPAVQALRASAPLVVFAACDGVYFDRFASALIHSTVRNAGLRCCFHLHVVNPPADVACRVGTYDTRLAPRASRCPSSMWT